jgi:hypothetical protein
MYHVALHLACDVIAARGWQLLSVALLLGASSILQSIRAIAVLVRRFWLHALVVLCCVALASCLVYWISLATIVPQTTGNVRTTIASRL